jgi:hypothetical protein
LETTPPVRTSTRVEHAGDELILSRRSRSIVVGGFLFLWLSVWTAGCALLIGRFVAKPTLEHFLFGLPFWAAWCFVAGLLAWLLFGAEQLRVGAGGIEYVRRALISLGRRRVPLAEIQGLAVGRKSGEDDPDTGSVRRELTIANRGRPLRVFGGADEKELAWLAERIRQHLRERLPDRPIAIAKDEPAEDDARVEALKPQGAIPEPPSETAIRLRRD